MFPDTDPKWKGADSIALLKGAVARVREAGYRLSNVDVPVIAQQPKLLPHLDAMRANLAAALGVDPSAVSVKGKTNEGVDSMGRGESMAAMRWRNQVYFLGVLRCGILIPSTSKIKPQNPPESPKSRWRMAPSTCPHS